MGMDRAIQKKKFPLGLMIGGGLVLALIALFSYQLLFVDKTPIQTAKKSEIKLYTVKRGDFQEYFLVDCFVAPDRSIFIDSQEYGIVQSVRTEQGSVVGKGQVLIVLQNDELESKLLLKEAELRDAMQDRDSSGVRRQQLEARGREQLFELDHQIDVAKDDCETKEALFDASAISKSDLQKARRELEYWTSKREMAVKSNELDLALQAQEDQKLRNSIDILKLDLRRLQERIGSLAIVSPAYGQITSFSASVGEAKNIGSRIAQLDIMDSLKMKANLDEYYLPKLEVGNKGSFTSLDVKGGEVEYGVRVSWISPDVKNSSFEADFKFDAAPANLRIGQRFLVRIELGKKRESVLLAQGQYFQTTGGRWVYLVDASGGAAARKDIVAGRSNPDFLEVLSGLAPGDRVIVSDYSGFNGLQRISLR
jgi:HlyD family secretion protein